MSDTKPTNDTDHDENIGASVGELRSGRWNTVGVPTEKSKDFKATSKRLINRMADDANNGSLLLF